MSERLNVVILGHGQMGRIHADAAISARDEIETQHNFFPNLKIPPLDISLVESDFDNWPELTSKPRHGPRHICQSVFSLLDLFRRTEQAIDIVVMAFNDSQHYYALQQIQDWQPNIKALFSEKPLTATDAEARKLAPWLADKFVTLNTVINFSPVFDELKRLQAPNGLLQSAIPIGFETAWGKDRTKDMRPTTGIGSDINHPLGIVTEMLGQEGVSFLRGAALKGLLSNSAPNVVYAHPETEWVTDLGLPLRQRARYDATEQERRVIAWYRQADGGHLAVQLDFDLRLEGQRADTLKIYEIPEGKMSSPKEIHAFTGFESKTDTGLARQDAPRDKARAFVGRSLRAFFNQERPDYMAGLSNLDVALKLSGAIGAASEANPELKVAQATASESLAALHAQVKAGNRDVAYPFAGPLETARPENIASRLSWLESRANNEGLDNLLQAANRRSPVFQPR